MRVIVAATLLVAWVGVAGAGPKRKVRIETVPPGAVVYIEDKESGPACQPTPCNIEVAVGETTVIVELELHEPQYKTIKVPKRGKISAPLVSLDPAVGTIVVDGPVGALVIIGGVEYGKAPKKIEIAAEAHNVVITKDGKTLFDNFVSVETGQETTVTPKVVAGGARDDGEVPDQGGGEAAGGEIEKQVPGEPRPAFVQAHVAIDVGFRNFTYEGNGSPMTLRDENEGGQVIAGPLIEFWPGKLAGIRILNGLSLVGRFQHNLNQQVVVGSGIVNELKTYWQSFEGSARYRWTIANKFTLEPGAGYVRDRFQFEGVSEDIRLVPDADYQSFRIGGRASVLLGMFEPYLTVENRVVLSAGKLQTRFGASTSASGLRGSLGVQAKYGSITGRVEGSATQYSWTFESTPTLMASGGSDLIRQIQIAVGYEY